MSDSMTTTLTQPKGWPKRNVMMAMLLLALFLCYVDRVLISLAAVNMQKEFGWSDAEMFERYSDYRMEPA